MSRLWSLVDSQHVWCNGPGATVGTQQTVAAQELCIECMSSADEATEAHHAEMMAAAGKP